MQDGKSHKFMIFSISGVEKASVLSKKLPLSLLNEIKIGTNSVTKCWTTLTQTASLCLSFQAEVYR